MICPHCHNEISEADIARHFAAIGGRKGGQSTSEAKRQAARENGKRGGRPRKEKK